MSGKLVDRLLKKEWSDEHVQKYVGNYRPTHLTRAADLEVRRKSASGGVTSAFLIHGLQSGIFDGAVVCKTVLVEGKVRARFEIATTAEQVLSARGSKYVETRFLQEVLPLLRSFEGRAAVVGLPCDISHHMHTLSACIVWPMSSVSWFHLRRLVSVFESLCWCLDYRRGSVQILHCYWLA